MIVLKPSIGAALTGLEVSESGRFSVLVLFTLKAHRQKITIARQQKTNHTCALTGLAVSGA